MTLIKHISVVSNKKMHLSFAFMSLPTYTALTVSTMLRGGVKINGCLLTLSNSVDLILSHLL